MTIEGERNVRLTWMKDVQGLQETRRWDDNKEVLLCDAF